MSLIVSYLGPEGTFTHQAALAFAQPGDELLPLATGPEVVQSVESGAAASGILAFENSYEGHVSANLDELLLATSRCLIAGERVLPVTFTLFRVPGDQQPLEGVVSHPFALAQCSEFIGAAGLQTREALSTAGACQELAAAPVPGWGVLGPPLAGELYQLRVEREHLENDESATTRFVALKTSCGPASGKDRSAFSVRPRRDESGSLVHLLQEFALRDINLTAIKSRPTKELLGEYIFYLECEGHISEPRVGEAVRNLLRLQPATRFLGSFPEDVGRPPQRQAQPNSGGEAYADMLSKLR